MLNGVLVIFAFVVLMLVLNITSKLDSNKNKKVLNNVFSSFSLLLLLFLIPFISYEIWLILGHPEDFRAVYIMGGTGIVLILFSFIYYNFVSRNKK